MAKTVITLPSLGLTDANADRILMWDDSAGAIAQLTASTNLTISGTNVTASGGKVLQYVAATPTIGETSTTSGSLVVGGGGINLAITPSSSSNKILIAFHCLLAAQEDNGVFVDIQRAISGGATTSGIANAESGSATQGLGGFGSAANAGTWYGMVGQFFVDDPSTTSEITYKPMFARWFGSGTVYMGNNASICSGYAMELET
tara:strand:+ start:66 stop:674 length:609 start_codon:yes stop_codon:yes gene_type:complete